jgi:hypothetical protein
MIQFAICFKGGINVLLDQIELFSDQEIVEINQPNEMIKAFGSGPVDKRCGGCAFLKEVSFTNSHVGHICMKRTVREHHPRWESCGKFEAIKV